MLRAVLRTPILYDRYRRAVTRMQDKLRMREIKTSPERLIEAPAGEENE